MIRQKRVGPSPSEARLNKGWDRVRETPPHSNAGRSGTFLNTQRTGGGFPYLPIAYVLRPAVRRRTTSIDLAPSLHP